MVPVNEGVVPKPMSGMIAEIFSRRSVCAVGSLVKKIAPNRNAENTKITNISSPCRPSHSVFGPNTKGPNHMLARGMAGSFLQLRRLTVGTDNCDTFRARLGTKVCSLVPRLLDSPPVANGAIRGCRCPQYGDACGERDDPQRGWE